MRVKLRRMGNATGLIVPKAVLREAGVESGTTLDLVVEDGRIIASPVRDHPRAGWAEAADAIAAAPEPTDEAAWRGFANAGDADLTWRSAARSGSTPSTRPSAAKSRRPGRA